MAFDQSTIERSDVASRPGLSSFGASLTLFGIPRSLSIYPSLIILIFLATIMFLIWRKHGVHSDMACAALCAAIPFSTPYLWH